MILFTALVYAGLKYDCIVRCPEFSLCNALPNLAADFFLPLLESIVLLLFIWGLHDVLSSNFSLLLVVEPQLSAILSGVTSVDLSLLEFSSLISVTAAAVSGVNELPVYELFCCNGSMSIFEFCLWSSFKLLNIETGASPQLMFSFLSSLRQSCSSDDVSSLHPLLGRTVFTAPLPCLSVSCFDESKVHVSGVSLNPLHSCELCWLYLLKLVTLFELFDFGVDLIVDFCCTECSGVLNWVALDDSSL